MFSLATLKALQVYGISIVISMLVAVLIKIMVVATSRVGSAAKTAKAPQPHPVQPVVRAGVPSEVVAAVSAALAAVTGPHRILHIAESKRTWSHQGRIAQHSHQPRH